MSIQSNRHRPVAGGGVAPCLHSLHFGVSLAAIAAISLVATPAAAQTGQSAPSTAPAAPKQIDVIPAPPAASPPQTPATPPVASPAISSGTAPQATPPAATAQVPINPVDVTAAKPKKKPAKVSTPAKSAPAPQPEPAQASAVSAPGPAVQNPADGAGGQSAPVTVQGQTQLGRLTVATPLNGTVVEREELEDVRAVDQLRELLRRVPGVSLVRNIRIPAGGKGYTNNLVDGYSLRSASLGNSGFIDDINTLDVEAIEVTRGPGSVLHSSKAVGGTINVVTRDPPRTPEQAVSAEMGQYGMRRVGAYATGSSASGGVGYSINANHLEDDSWRDRNGRTKDAGSAKLVFKPNDDTKITVRGELIDSYREFPGVLTEAQFDANWRQAVPKNLYEDLHFGTAMLAVKRRIGEGGELELAYVRHHNWGTNACPAGCSNSVASTGRQTEIDYVTDNYRAVYRQDFDFLKSRVYLGIDAFLSDKNDDTYNRTNFTRTTLNSAFTVEETNLAPFLQYEFSPIDRLRFTLGVRHEDYKLGVDDRSPTTNRDGEKEYSDLVRKGGVTYEFVDNHRVWGSIAEGFYVPDTGSTVSGANAKDLPPETSLTYGAGLRGVFPGKVFSYDIGYYHSIIENQAVSQPCPTSGPTRAILCPQGGATYPVAAGKVLFQGVETGIGVRPWEFLRFDVAHTYALNTFVEFVDSGIDYSGKNNSASPKHHVNARVTVFPMPGLRVELEGDYISRYYTNNLNTDSYARPILYNLRTSYQVSENVELWGHVLNLFDTKYAERISATNVVNPVRSYSEGYGPLTMRAGVMLKW